MNELQATAVMIGLFALRCVVPLLLTLAVARLMNLLLERWSADEEASTEKLPQSIPLPGAVSASVTTPAPSISIACWLLRNCDEAQRAKCAAYRRQGIPCWQARLIEEGKLPDACPTCPRYAALQGAM